MRTIEGVLLTHVLVYASSALVGASKLADSAADSSASVPAHECSLYLATSRLEGADTYMTYLCYN
jgi:hypothetical protein